MYIYASYVSEILYIMGGKTFHIELIECKIYTQGDVLLKVFFFSFHMIFFSIALKPAKYTQQTFSCSCVPPPWPYTLFCSSPLRVLPCSCLGCKFFMPRVFFPRVRTEPKTAGAWCFWARGRHKQCLWRRWICNFPHPGPVRSQRSPSRVTCSSVAMLSTAQGRGQAHRPRCEQARQRQVRRGIGWDVDLAGNAISVSCLLSWFWEGEGGEI